MWQFMATFGASLLLTGDLPERLVDGSASVLTASGVGGSIVRIERAYFLNGSRSADIWYGICSRADGIDLPTDGLITGKAFSSQKLFFSAAQKGFPAADLPYDVYFTPSIL